MCRDLCILTDWLVQPQGAYKMRFPWTCVRHKCHVSLASIEGNQSKDNIDGQRKCMGTIRTCTTAPSVSPHDRYTVPPSSTEVSCLPPPALLQHTMRRCHRQRRMIHHCHEVACLDGKCSSRHMLRFFIFERQLRLNHLHLQPSSSHTETALQPPTVRSFPSCSCSRSE